jgi:sugar phosphate isomerase/epimerase
MARLFPLAVISDEVSQDIVRVVSFAKEFELDGIEVRSLFGRAFKDLTKEDVRHIRSRFSDNGIKVAGCATPVFKCNIDNAQEIAEHIDIFKRSVEKAVEWDCDLLRVFTFLRKSTPSTEKELDAAASHFPKLLEAIKGTNLRIGIENEYSTIVGNGAEMSHFLKAVNSPKLGVVWDPCNVVFMPDTGNPVEKDYPLLADQVIHFHVKDAARKGHVAEHCVEVGKGEIDFSTQLKELKQRGYKGWVSLETHWRKKELSKEAAHLPAGHAFSADAEPASRICMTNLIQMIERL